VYSLEEKVEHWIVGRRSIGCKGFVPVWERSQTSILGMLVAICDKSLNKLEELIVGYTQDKPLLEELRVDDSASRTSANSRRSAPLR
jgi:hypothetical protein